MQSIPRRPALFDTMTELPRAGLEATRLALSLPSLYRGMPRGDGHPVLVLPAYGTGDLGLWPLRRFLEGLGYVALESALGTNLDRGELRIRRVEDAARFRRVQSERVVRRAREICEQTGEKPSLVGWSMGGLFAFDAARLAPDAVRRAVTLGSPFGDPRGTSMWDVMRRISGSRVPPEEQDFETWLRPVASDDASPAAPVTILYSERDGIVGEDAARIDEKAARSAATHDLLGVRYERIASSHLGFAVNREAYRAIAWALAAEPRPEPAASPASPRDPGPERDD
ncbi:MAG: alpha/beta fold hydrolase [Deltaproteobacteria bacterium]|nr:alpha/beta fold hydrolase [Deltaproteobacteria bacterium]